MGKKQRFQSNNPLPIFNSNDPCDEQQQIISNDAQNSIEQLQIELDYDELLKNRIINDKKSDILIRLSAQEPCIKKGGKKGRERKKKKKVQQIDIKDITDIVIIVLLVLILGVSLFRVVMEVQIQYKKAQQEYSHNKAILNTISEQSGRSQSRENHQNSKTLQQKQPQIEITLTPQCQFSIDNLLKYHGNLYDFKFPDQEMKLKSKVDNYVQAKNTFIDREKYSEAITLLRLIHNVDANGMITFGNDSCEDEKQKRKRIETTMNQQLKRWNIKYQMAQYHSRQLPFCLVINSFNNAKSGLIYRNLDSILQQNYTNYHIVYTDDNSTDQTGAKVLEYLKLKNVTESKYHVTINEKKIGMMENIYLGVNKGCKDGEIVVMIDGDDSLIGINVLALLNAVYQKEKIAMLWSNFVCIFNNNQVSMGFSRDYSEKQKTDGSFRKMKGFISSHLKTFYVDLFKKIKPEDLQLNNGKFYGGASDTAMMIPMIEMANPKFKYLPEVLYEYRYDTGQTGNVVNKVPQKEALAKIFSAKEYEKLRDFSFIERAIENAMVIPAIKQTQLKTTQIFQRQMNLGQNQ